MGGMSDDNMDSLNYSFGVKNNDGDYDIVEPILNDIAFNTDGTPNYPRDYIMSNCVTVSLPDDFSLSKYLQICGVDIADALDYLRTLFVKVKGMIRTLESEVKKDEKDNT